MEVYVTPLCNCFLELRGSRMEVYGTPLCNYFLELGGSRMELDEGTPVSSRTRDIRKPEHIAFDRLKITTPGVKTSSPTTPG